MNIFETEEESDVAVLENEDRLKKLVVYNDPINTFEHVIRCFIEICKLDFETSKEKTYEIHNEGQSVIKEGSSKEMNDLRMLLSIEGLSAKVEE